MLHSLGKTNEEKQAIYNHITDAQSKELSRAGVLHLWQYQLRTAEGLPGVRGSRKASCLGLVNYFYLFERYVDMHTHKVREMDKERWRERSSIF